MTLTRLAPLAAVLVFAASGAAAQVDPGRIDAVFQPWASMRTPGCAISIVDHGKETVRAYGSADLEHDVPIDASTVFEAGSVSKQFTAASILLLAKDGKLSLSDDVRKYVPELPDYGKTITLQNLINHTSGLRDWGDIVAMEGWERSTRAVTTADMLDVIVRQKSLNFAPGSAYSYSNTGYNLAALVVERVSGQSLQAFTRARLFQPLGMGDTQWRDDFRRIVKRRAVAYSKIKDGYEQLMPFENPHGHGGLLTTVGDLQRWNRALSENTLGVTPQMERKGLLSDGRSISYASGLRVDRHGVAREIAHGGATAGYRAYLARYPDQALSVALLCNTTDSRPDTLAYKVIDLYLPTPPAERVVKAEETGRAGVWISSQTGTPATLVADKDGLAIEGFGPLTPIAKNGWRFAMGQIAFEGPDVMLMTDEDGTVVRYRRAAPWSPTGADLDQLAGRWASAEARASYTIRREDAGAVLALDGRPEKVVPLKPIYPDAFEGGDLLVRVIRDDKGAPTALSFGSSRAWDVRFSRAD